MFKNQIVIFLFFFLCPFLLMAECPDGKMIVELLSSKKFSALSPTKQLRELLAYENAAQYCAHRNDSTRILLLQSISKLYLQHAECSKALYYATKAINIVNSNPQIPSINKSCQIRNYYILAGVYDSLKKTTEKIKAYDSCIAVARRLNVVNLFFILSLLENVKYLNYIGDYNICIDKAELGIFYSHRYIPEKGRNPHYDSTWYSLAFAVQKANALLALNNLEIAEKFLASKISQCRTEKALEYFGVMYELLATVKMMQKNYESALRYFHNALKCYKDQNDMVSYKGSIHNIGFLYDEIYKDYKKTLYYYKMALKIVVNKSNRSKLDSVNSINIYSNIGDVYARSGQFDSAECYFQYAFNQIRKGTNETEVLNSSSDEFIENENEYLTGLFFNKGNGFYQQYLATKNPKYITEAIRVYKLMDRLLERIKTNQVELQSKLFWRRNTHPFYEKAIEVCIIAGKAEEAFYFFERSRAVLLYDQMKEQEGLGGTDILKQQELGSKIIDLQKKMGKTNPDSPEFKRLQNDMSDFRDAQNHLLQQIKLRNPVYFGNFLDSNAISLKETRTRILGNQSLIEIFEGDSAVYLMMITSNDIYFNKIKKSDYDSTINLCALYMSNAALSNSKSQFSIFVKNSAHLFDLIFQNRKVPDGRIIISPDGHYFPFETLITGADNNTPVYLIQQHAVSYTYSARYLMSQFKGNTSLVPSDFLGIAPVEFPATDQLPSLPGSDVAIKNIGAYFKDSDTLLHKSASKNNFIKKFGLYQVILLYSHSSDSSARDEPVIYFADEPLYLSELKNIPTPATKLIVLSACETGRGHFYQGEGMFSFNRAFAALGIPSCVNNLWSVENESTYRLTELFYKYISKGITTDEALQRAKIEFIKSSSAKKQKPYYWAATVLAGKADSIQFRDKSNSLTIFAIVSGVSALLLIGQFGFHKRKRPELPHYKSA